jgi:hypothetical protein
MRRIGGIVPSADQLTLIEFRSDGAATDSAGGHMWTTRWYPPVQPGEDAVTRVGHCLVVCELDWVSSSSAAVFMLQHWDGQNESTQSPLLYGNDSDTATGPVGSWRSQLGALVPPGRQLLPATPAEGSIVLLRGYWLPEGELENLQVGDTGNQVPLPDLKPPPFPVLP